MALTRDSLLTELASLQVEHDVHDHRPVLTTEAQAAALAGVDGALTKNLFLKDKKNRLYIVTALTDTKVDLKVLSARLGVGKGGVRMAPEELLEPVLQVAQGSITPLAACQPTADCVVLIMDRKIDSVERVLVHPLVNTSTLSITPTGLSTILRSHGREPVYVELDAALRIDKDNPPDLKEIADAAQPCELDASGQEQKLGARSSPSKREKPSNSSQEKAGLRGGGEMPAEADNVMFLAAKLLNMVNEKLDGGESSSTSHATALEGLRADFEMELNAFRNVAYSRGFMASRDQIKAACSGGYP